MKNNNNNNYERSGNSSSKKGKNKCTSSTTNNSNSNSNSNNNNIINPEKPRQPQRGLGVAQLEKIRLHTQMASCGLIPPHPFLNPSFQHVPDDIKFQLAYHQGVPPPPPPPQQQPYYSSPSVSPSAYGYHHPNAFMMGMGDHMERTGNIGYNESQLCNTARWNDWNPNNNIRVTRESQPDLQPLSMVTRHLLSQVEQQNRSNGSFESMNSGNQNSELSENEELDLELKL